MDELLLRGGEVLTPDGRLERADVLLSEGRIVEVAQALEADARVHDAAETVIAPGFVNAHYHSNENFNAGLYEGLPLDVWFVRSHQVTRTEPPSPEAIYTRTMLGAVQLLLGGTTAVVDFVFEAPEITVQTLEPIVQAYRDVGLRATVLLGVADLHYLSSLDLDPADLERASLEFSPPSVERVIEVARDAVERWHQPGGMTGIGLGPSAPQRCSPALLDATMALAREGELVWQTHVQETRTQAVTAQRWHGRSFVRSMQDQGVLGPASTLVHTVWLDDHDRELIAANGASVVHCPYSNLRLGDGVANVPELRRAGVHVSLGTDGRGCDETLDMLELLRLTALLHKVHGLPPEQWLTAREALTMATSAGSRSAGHGDALGRVEPGASADLVLFSRRSPTFTPLHDPIRQLVFGATARDIRSVIVNGRIVVQGGRVLGIDLERLLDDAVRCAAKEVSAGGANAQIEEAVWRMFSRAEAAPHHVDSYVGG
jgi:cytosine/adenosine deaminase-related metal-dependent hydrolase